MSWPSRRSSAAPASRSGKTTFAHAGVGHGAIVQFVVRSLTTLPASLSAGKRSRPTRAGSRSSSSPGATGPERPTRAAPISPRASNRLPCQSGMKSRSSSRAAYSTRARLTHGSKYCTSTNLAPWRYALAATARTMYSLPGSQPTETTCPGCTFAPNPTTTSAKRRRVPSSIAPTLREVGRVVERAQQPRPSGDDHQPGERAVVRVDERERPAVRRLPAGFADDAAVHHGRHADVRARRGDHRLDPRAYAPAEALHVLRARDDVPALLGDGAERDRVALRHPDPELPALPLAERDFAQVVHDHGPEVAALDQRRGGHSGSPQRRHEQRRGRIRGQPLRDRERLRLSVGGQRRVAVAVEHGERLAGHRRLGGAVADEHDLRGSRGKPEATLVVGGRHRGIEPRPDRGQKPTAIALSVRCSPTTRSADARSGRIHRRSALLDRHQPARP